MRAFFSAVVRFFLTGVAALLPLVVTVFVVTWVLTVADAYIGPSSNLGRFIRTVFGASHSNAGYVVGYLVVCCLIILLGFLVTRATVRKLQQYIDSMVARIPLIGKVYSTVGQVVELFGRKDQSSLERFGGVGYVRVGNIRMVGLLTSRERYATADGRECVLVYIPASPIPATGFNMLVPVRDFQLLEIPVEDMAKLLMSLGLLGPQILRKKTPVFIDPQVINGRNNSTPTREAVAD